ncbi:hypothetical protein AGR1A_Cc40230 [Agrobacterium fabacearum CFBP 5771]|nr:hypothetical protein AGR1A_Cc40230 [Agrobacterium fabacearum CFBP 5771]
MLDNYYLSKLTTFASRLESQIVTPFKLNQYLIYLCFHLRFTKSRPLGMAGQVLRKS